MADRSCKDTQERAASMFGFWGEHAGKRGAHASVDRGVSGSWQQFQSGRLLPYPGMSGLVQTLGNQMHLLTMISRKGKQSAPKQKMLRRKCRFMQQ